MKFGIVMQGRIIATDEESDDQLVDLLDAAMNELVTLGVEDPTIDLNLADKSVEVEVVIAAANPFGAISFAHGAIRTALHATGICNPDWPALRPEDGPWAMYIDHVSIDAEDVSADPQQATVDA